MPPAAIAGSGGQDVGTYLPTYLIRDTVGARYVRTTEYSLHSAPWLGDSGFGRRGAGYC